MEWTRRALARLVPLALAAVLSACATDDGSPPGLEYAEARGADSFPAAGASLAETLASLVGERTTDALVQARDVRVLRIDVEPWLPVPTGEARAGRVAPAPGAIYAVVASFNCQSRVNRQRFYGEKTGWYLLPDGRLAAWDHYAFGDACTMHDFFEPATGTLVDQEKRVIAWMHEKAPRSVVHAGEIYAKGIAYARVGRIDDARASLVAGDAAFDATTDHKILLEGGRDERYTADRAALRGGGREALVQAIADAEARSAGAAPQH